MLSQVITACVEAYALADRASDRRRMIEAADARAAAHERAGAPRTIVVVRSASEMRELRALPDASAVVVVDCALERCDDEEDLLRCWGEVCRVAGATDERADDVYVLHLQRWASARVSLDPRVRWVILGAPPRRDGTGRLEYRPFGRRRTILADIAEARCSRAAGAGSTAPEAVDTVAEEDEGR